MNKSKYSPEVIERSVRMVMEARNEYSSQWAAIESIAGKIGGTAETLRRWVRQHETDTGLRNGVTTAEQERIRTLDQVARCTVERLMRRAGLRGAIRGKTVRTTVSNPAAPCPLDRVNRQFRADRLDQLWVSDFTYVPTWQGMIYVAFVIDVFARRIGAVQCIRSLFWMHWNRHCMHDSQRGDRA